MYVIIMTWTAPVTKNPDQVTTGYHIAFDSRTH